jgi:primosomal replication protein N
LRARITERGALRYTPAGLPAVDLVLRHEGSSVEAQRPRQVVVEVKAKAIGAELLEALRSIDGDADFTGFLAAARNGRGVVFHLNTAVPAASPAAPHVDHR